jgi:hypothetical protein
MEQDFLPTYGSNLMEMCCAALDLNPSTVSNVASFVHWDGKWWPAITVCFVSARYKSGATFEFHIAKANLDAIVATFNLMAARSWVRYLELE